MYKIYVPIFFMKILEVHVTKSLKPDYLNKVCLLASDKDVY